jgi:hypothetical protein
MRCSYESIQKMNRSTLTHNSPTLKLERNIVIFAKYASGNYSYNKLAQYYRRAPATIHNIVRTMQRKVDSGLLIIEPWKELNGTK